MDNGPAHAAANGSKLQKGGETVADPFEISILRREDLAAHKGLAFGDDLIQSAKLPSSRTSRGHQGTLLLLTIKKPQ